MHQTPKLAQLTQPSRPACSQASPDHGHGRAPPRLAPCRAPLLCPASLLPSAPIAWAHAPLLPVRLLAVPACACCARPACAYLRACSLRTPRAPVLVARQCPTPSRLVPARALHPARPVPARPVPARHVAVPCPSTACLRLRAPTPIPAPSQCSNGQ